MQSFFFHMIRVVLLFSFFFLFSFGGFSQSDLHSSDKGALKKYSKARKKYSKNDYSDALVFVDDAIRKDSTFFESYILKYRIGKKLNDTLLQISSLSDLVRLSPSFAPNSLFVLADYYFSKADYEKAVGYYREFLRYCSSSNRRIVSAKRAIRNCEFAINEMNNPRDVVVSGVSAVNSEFNDYWPSINAYTNEILFTRLGGAGSSGDENVMGFSVSDSTFFDVPVNTSYNEGTPSMTADGRFMFFSSNHPNGFGSHDIYVIERRDGVWGRPINVGEPVNTMNWESQASISADGKTLYFASTRPGGKGGSDIYMSHLVRWSSRGFPVFSDPVNISVNTGEDDMAPCIFADNSTLFFSTVGLPGMGGMDIFESKVVDGAFLKPVNLGFPVNGNKDELGFSLSQDGESVLFCSDRRGSRDVYTYKLSERFKQNAVVNRLGAVVDSLGTGVSCRLCVVGDSSVFKLDLDSDGEFSLFLSCGEDYTVYFIADGYNMCSEDIVLRDSVGACSLYGDVVLSKVFVGDKSVLKSVHFDFDSFVLKESSYGQLGVLVEFLKCNSLLNIEIGGHTDDIGSDSYNMELSVNRAKTIYDYLITKGISKDRLYYKGYGNSVPLDSNVFEEGRIVNRRTEIKIVSK